MSGAATSPFGLLTGAVRRALRWAVLGCLALSACQPAHAASLVWTNLNILGVTNDATYLFTPTPQPGTSGGALATGGSAAATTTNGIGTVSLLAGRYTVRITGRDPFVIWVPNASGTYNLTQLYRDANGGVVPSDAPFLATTGGELTGNLRFSGVLSGGVIPPHLTTAQRDSLNTVSNGMLIFNVTLGTNQVRGPGGWFNFPGGTDTNQFATLATLTNVANAQAQAALQSSTNYTDGIVGLYTLLSTFESATNTLTGLINSAGVSAETATNIARSVVAQSNLINQSQLSTATGAVYAAIPDISTLATKAALEATNAALVALIDSETAPFITAAQATNIAAYQALIVSNGVTLLIPSTNGLASIPFVTATSNALQSQIGSAGISAETGTNIARAVVGQSNLVNAAQVAAQIASSNLVTASITNDLASIEYARSLTNNFATQAFVTAATNTLDGKFASYTTLTLTTNIANAVGQVVSNAVVLLIPSTNGFITLAQLTVASNALQTQIDAIDGVTSAEATNIAASVVGGSNYVTLATLNTSSNAIRAAIPSTNGFVTQTITNGLASIYFVQAVSNWVPTQIQSTNGLASTNWVASYNYHAQTNGVLPRWAAETLTADGRYGVNLNSSDGEINLLSSGEIVLESSTGLRLLTSSGQVNVENSDLTVDGNFTAGGAMFGSAGTGLTNIHWPGPGISNVVAGDGILLSTNTGVLVIEATGSGGGSTNGINGTQATNIFTGLAIASNWTASSTFNSSTSAIVGLVDARTTSLSNYVAASALTNANAAFERLVTNNSVKTISAGSNVTIDNQGTNLVISASLSGGAASLGDITNTVNALSILANAGTGTSNTFSNPTNTYTAAAASGRGFSNFVFVANRPDGRDGDGFTRENPRHASDGAAVSNIFRSLRSGTRLEFLSGSEWTNLNLVLQPSNPGQTNGLFQLHGLRDVEIVGGKFRGTNYGTMFTVWQSTNITFRDMDLSSPRSHTRLTNSAHALIVCAIGPTENVVFKDMIMPEYTQHGFGQYGTDHKGWTVLNSKFNDGGNTNVPSLFIDGVAISVNSGWALIDGNRFTRLSRGFETYIPPSSTTWMTNVVVVNNTFHDIEQAAIQHYGDSTATNSGLLNGFVFANNVITMANTNAAIPSGASLPVGIVVLGGARNGVIANNVVSSSDTGHFYAGSGINVTASQGHQEDILVAHNRIEGIFQDRGIQTYGNTFGTGGGFYPQANVTIDGNHLDQCNTTILIGGLYPVVQNNKLGTHYVHGINVSAATLGAEIKNNTTRGFNVPVVYVGAATNTVMQGNNWDRSYVSDNGVGTVQNEVWRWPTFHYGSMMLSNSSVFADAITARSLADDYSGRINFMQNGVNRASILSGTGAAADSGKLVFEVDGRSHFTILTNILTLLRAGGAGQSYLLFGNSFNNTNGTAIESYGSDNTRQWYLGTDTNDNGLVLQSTAGQTRFLGTKSLTISNGVAYGDGAGLTNLNAQPPSAVLTNLAANAANTVTNVTAGRGASATISGGTLTPFLTNAIGFVATNAATFVLDLSAPTNRYELTAHRNNLTVVLTNGVSGDAVNLRVYGATNTQFLVQIAATNRLLWNIYAPTNALNTVTVTNGMVERFYFEKLSNGDIEVQVGKMR